MTGKPEIQGLNIVLIGGFNPKIFQPAWFAGEGLIKPSEAEAAEIKIINPEITIFDMDWLQVQITRESCFFGTLQEAYYEPLLDLCFSTFKLLRHTPIGKMGINRDVHFKMGSEEEWHGLGHKLAPKELWNTILQKPGMQSLTIQGIREDEYKGYIRVKVEPSIRIRPGVYIQVNDHFEVDEPIIGCEKILNILETSYSRSKNKAESIITAIMDWR